MTIEATAQELADATEALEKALVHADKEGFFYPSAVRHATHCREMLEIETTAAERYWLMARAQAHMGAIDNDEPEVS